MNGYPSASLAFDVGGVFLPVRQRAETLAPASHERRLARADGRGQAPAEERVLQGELLLGGEGLSHRATDGDGPMPRPKMSVEPPARAIAAYLQNTADASAGPTYIDTYV